MNLLQLSLSKLKCFFLFELKFLPLSKDVVPQFDLRVELWSCALEEELTLVNTPKKLAKKFRNSFGKTSGKKVCSLLDTPDPDTFLQNNPIPSYVLLSGSLIKYYLGF